MTGTALLQVKLFASKSLWLPTSNLSVTYITMCTRGDIIDANMAEGLWLATQGFSPADSRAVHRAFVK